MRKDRFLSLSTKKERHLLKYRSTVCLNCHHPLDISDEYCSNCGQLNSTKKLAFNDFFNEFFAGIFAYDSRLYRTLGVLLFKPGKISKDYIEGKRVRYANPYRFYLSASIIFFLIWSLTHDVETLGIQTDAKAEVSPQQIREADSILTVRKEENPALGFVLPDIDTVTVKTAEVFIPEKEVDTMDFFVGLRKKLEIFSKFYEEKEIKNPTIALDSLNYSNTRFNHWLYKKTVDAEMFSSDSSLFIKYFISKLPFHYLLLSAGICVVYLVALHTQAFYLHGAPHLYIPQSNNLVCALRPGN